MKPGIHALRVLLCLTAFHSAASSPSQAASHEDVFNDRLLPIFRSSDPSSCVQCHLSSVDLKDYILPSSDQTFASLREQGLINLEEPSKSKILELISMGERDYDKGAVMIHEKMRKAEYEAFSNWIQACARDSRLKT